jgi:hypothetical protein
MNELMLFNNDEFGKIRVVEIDNEPWFVGRDVVRDLGYDLSTHSYTDYVKKYCNKEDIKKLNNCDAVLFGIKDAGRKGEILINEFGIQDLISNCKTKSEQYLYNFIQWLLSENLITPKLSIHARKEIEFLDELEDALSPFNIKGIRQYSVIDNKYRIDYYIPSINVAIEYDENNHRDYSYEQHEGRQEEIENQLKCRFIRISDDNTNSYNIGFVIKNIFNI